MGLCWWAWLRWVGVKGAVGVGRGTTTCMGMGMGGVGKTVESYFIVLSVLKFKKKLKILQEGSYVRNSNEERQHFIFIFFFYVFLIHVRLDSE